MSKYKTIKKMLFVAMYHGFAKFLPASYSPFVGKMCKSIRGWIVYNILENCGTNVNIEKGANFSTRSKIGNNSGIGINASFGIIYIGDNVLMGKECIGVTRNHQFMDKDRLIFEQGYMPDEPIIIGNDVWIGHRVTILPGVCIADGCVIGAGAVVAKDTEPYGVYAGNPARKIKERLKYDKKKIVDN